MYHTVATVGALKEATAGSDGKIFPFQQRNFFVEKHFVGKRKGVKIVNIRSGYIDLNSVFIFKTYIRSI